MRTCSTSCGHCLLPRATVVASDQELCWGSLAYHLQKPFWQPEAGVRADRLRGHPHQFGPIDLRRRTQTLREDLLERIAAMFPGDVLIVRRGGRWRSRLRLRGGLMVSVLVARLAEENKSFLDFHVFPNMGGRRRCISLDAPWLDRGRRLHDLRGFCAVVKNACATQGGALGLFKSRT
jgi:hypothetical protein